MRDPQPHASSRRSTRTLRLAWTMALAGVAVAGLAAAPGAFAAAPLGPPVARATSDSARRALAGVTLDAHGRALAGVEIRLAPLGASPGAMNVVRALSDASGRFALDRLAPGAYRLVAVKGGYAVLVGQINTLVQDTLELILHPAGAPGEPGARPDDAGWALRLPHRDILEQRGLDVARALPPSPIAPGEFTLAAPPAFSIEAATTRVSGANGGPTGSGNSVAFDATMVTLEQGSLGGRFSHHDDGEADGARDRSETLRLAWLPPGSDSGRFFSVGLELLQRVSRLDDGGSDPMGRLSVSGMNWAASRSVESEGYSSDVRLQLGLMSVSGADAVAPEEHVGFNVMRLAATGSVGRSAGAHQLSVGGTVAAVRGALRDDLPGGPGLANLPFSGSDSMSGLAGAAGDRVAAYGGDVWHVADDFEFEARARAEWNRGYDGGSRGATVVGARWNVTPWAMLRAEGGVNLGGQSAGARVGMIELVSSGDTFTVSAARHHEIGPISWLGESDDQGLDLLFLAGPDMVLDRWSVGISWRAAATAPEFRLRGELFDASGDFAPRLPVDLSLVPLALQGHAVGQRWELAMALARTGTVFSVQWDNLEDRGEGGWLLGADRWSRRTVSMRQRLATLLRQRAVCYVVVAAEANSLEGLGTNGTDPLRAALLQRHRLSGGMALTF